MTMRIDKTGAEYAGEVFWFIGRSHGTQIENISSIVNFQNVILEEFVSCIESGATHNDLPLSLSVHRVLSEVHTEL